MYSTGNLRNIENHIKRICTIKGPIKDLFMDEWREVFRECYRNINQYGFCEKNRTYGVLTSRGSWSPVNQFNTNYFVNIKIVEKLNEWIFQDYFLKGINEFNGEPLTEIVFENNSPDYVEKEIKNYFKWLRHYKDRVFVDHRLLGPSDFLYELFHVASKTIGSGTYGELCIEYHFKKNIKTAKIYRTSLVRGSSIDMVNGCDLFTINIEDETKVKKIQSKVVKFQGNSFKNIIDVKDYIGKGIDFLVLVSLNYNFKFNTVSPDKMIFLYLKEDTIINQSDGWYTYNKNNILMQEKIDDMFNSKIFFEFFMYCSKNEVEFVLEVSEETNLNFIKDENKVIVNLPSNSEDFDIQKIYNVWVEIIQNISKKQEDIDFMMNTLKNLFEK
jgi:hypothetical protein